MENFLISKLKFISYKYRFQEKTLVVPSFDIGYQILENLASSGVGWINFKVATAASLAEEITEEKLYKEKLDRISTLESNFLVDEIFTRLAESGSLKYFEKHTINTGIISAIGSIIVELKSSGTSPLDLKSKYFVSINKAEDLKLIFLEYEKMLKEKKLVDSVDIVSAACDLIENSINLEDKKYIVLSRYISSEVEKKFLEKLCGRSLIVIDEEEIYGTREPKNRWKGQDRSEYKFTDYPDIKSNVERFRWLFDIENSPAASDDGTIDIFSSTAYQNEVKEIFRRLAASSTPLDSTEIIYTKSEPYFSAIYRVCEKLGIYATFSEGIPGDFSTVGMALKGFILWIKEDYGEVHLRKLLKNNLIKLKSKKQNVGSFSNLQLAHMLRISKIGWGRKRYSLVLNKEILRLENKIKNKVKENDLKICKKNLKLLAELRELSNKLLNLVPEIDSGGNIDLKLLSVGCIKFLDEFVGKRNENEASFKATLKERLKLLSRIATSSMPVEEAAQKLVEIISKIRFNKSGPKPGHIHISDFTYGGRSGRKNIFIVGFDSNKFPGVKTQDPVLLDEERKNLNHNLELSQDKLKKKLYEAASMLASLRAEVTVSFSNHDVSSDATLYPSSVFLQIFRLKINDSAADYQKMSACVGTPVGFVNKLKKEIAVDDTKWWLNKLAGTGTIKNAKESILKIYPGLAKGVFARECRNSSRLTEYDGKINPKGDELDPRKNDSIVLSCSRIELFAECPFAYFIEYILSANRPEETKKDLSRWLDVMQRGSLLHEVFQKFAYKLKNTKKILDIEIQQKTIIKILDGTVEKYKQEAPISNIAVFNHEYKQLKRDLIVFLKVNKELGNPCFLEMEFGYRGRSPVKVYIGSGSYLNLAGKVDRVDSVDENNYHVWDYKTGSAYSYNKEAYVAGGTQMQHVLYAKAVEEILKKTNPSAKVTKSGYVLPTEKGRKSGKGHLFIRDTSETERWQGALNIILDLISSGVFIVSDEENPPYLDDTDIYGDINTKLNIKVKIKNPENKVIGRWKELKNYK